VQNASVQTANRFEVTSIRPGSTAPRGGRGGGGCAGGVPEVEPNRFAITNATLYNLITLAYGIDCLNVSVHDLISGGPGGSVQTYLPSRPSFQKVLPDTQMRNWARDKLLHFRRCCKVC
jgi:hypothetical protein